MVNKRVRKAVLGCKNSVSKKGKKEKNLKKFKHCPKIYRCGTVMKNLNANAQDTRDEGSNPESGRSPGEEKGNPFQYSRLENPVAEEPGGLQCL